MATKREYICSIVKAFTESFQAFARQPGSQSELKDFILEEKEILFQVMCRAGEFNDIVVRNMAQLFFSYFLQQVLDLALPFREELEVLYVKLLLKPLEQLDAKLTIGTSSAQTTHTTSADKDKMQISTSSEASMGQVNFLSDDEDNGAESNRITSQAGAGSQSQDQSENFELEVCLNFLIETLLAL